MYSTHEADMDLPSLPLEARRVHIVPALQSRHYQWGNFAMLAVASPSMRSQ